MTDYKILPAQEILERYKKNISGIRSGRVNSSLLGTILVEVYGNKLHIHELATITLPEPNQLLITPFDKNQISAISKAINNSNLGVNPQENAAGIRLIFPPLTEEARKGRVAELHKMQEQAKIDVRVTRQDNLKHKKKAKDDGIISENDLLTFEKNLQLEVDKLNKEIEEITKLKETEIMKL